MKKLLLTLAVALGFGAMASATDYTIDPFKTSDWTTSKYDYDGGTQNKTQAKGSFTVDGATFNCTWKQEANTSAFSAQANQLRWYKDSQLSIEAPADQVITKIVITTQDDNKYVVKFAVAGESEPDITLNTTDKTITWVAANPVAKFVATATAAQIRVNKMVITTESAASSKKPANLSFGETTNFTIMLGDAFTAPTLTKATTAAVTYSSSVPAVAEVDAASGAVTVKGTGTTKIKATAAENDEFYGGEAEYTLNVIKTTKVDLVNIVFDGKFAIYMPTVGVATPFTTAYGYFFPEEVTVADNAFDVNEAYLFTFAKSGENWTIQRADGKFIGMNATNKSFNAYDTADAEGSNCYWTVTFDGNNVKIANTGRAGFYMYCCQYQGKWEITNTDAELGENEFLPQLFGDKAAAEAAGIADIATEAIEGAAEYYNLQGIRMQGELAPGLYIRREGNKAAKILVR